MSQQLRFNRKWASRNFNPGGTEIIDLPIGLDAESLQFYLTGTFTNSVAYTGIKSEGLAKLIRKVDLLLDGKTIATMSGQMLTHGNYAREGGLIKVNPGIGVGAQWCEIVGFLDLAHVGGVRPKDSSLRTLGSRQFQLAIQWGQVADMYTGAGVSTNDLKLGITIRETKELPGAAAPEVLRSYRTIEKLYAASMTDRIPLDPNVLYRGLMIRTEENGELATGVLSNVRVQVGTDVLIDLPRAEIVDVNTQDCGFFLPSGYYFIDFAPAPSGLVKVTDFLDLYGHADAFLILDISGAAGRKVEICAHEFEWLPGHIEHNRALNG